MSFVQVPLFGNNDGADKDRLNQIISNQNFLNENKVPMWYRAHGTVQTDNLKIAAGVNHHNNPTGVIRTRNVDMGNFFTPGTSIIVTSSFASTTANRCWVTIAARNRSGVQLDHTGFSVRVVSSDGSRLSGPNYSYWIAIGY